MSTLTAVQGSMASQSRATQLRFRLLLGGLTVLLLVSITLGITLGPVEIPVGAVWRIAASETLNVLSEITSLELNSWINIEENWTKAQFNIIWLIRFPRVLLGVFVGAGLAVVGVTMQALHMYQAKGKRGLQKETPV